MDDERIAVDSDLYRPNDADCPDDWHSETTSIGSSIYRGRMQNGRRYQTLRSQEYCLPVDDQQMLTYETGHLLALVLDSDTENALFQSPVKNPKHILDLGTGKGNWAIDVADAYPTATVRGVDLFPPPVSWMPPNCLLEIDDALQEWTWRDPFDLIHMRMMAASWTDPEWDRMYQQCFDNLQPGGWIEQLESIPPVECDDGSLPCDSILNTWGPYMMDAAKAAGRELNTMDTMVEKIRKAGFLDITVKEYKWPIGPWARDKKFKEAGMLHLQHWLTGMEGWCMWLLTKFGSPRPYTKEEVQIYVAKLRKEIKNPSYHTYQKALRVWARKPLPEEVIRVQIKREEDDEQNMVMTRMDID